MNIKTVAFKDVDGILCDTGKLKALYLPKYGGKLVSLRDFEEREWLAQDENTSYIPPRPESSYVECEVSGADEMFPTIDPCLWNGKEYPCHGEVCRVEHEYKICENSLEMEYNSKELGYSYKKTISEGASGEISVKYDIKNTAAEDMPCFWALHLMFAAVEGGEVFADYDVGDTAEIMFDDTKKYGLRGSIINVSDEHLTSKSVNGEAYKFYYLPRIKNGVCGYFDKKSQKGIELRFDSKKIPFFGVWMNNGGFKNMYSAAIEPCTLPFDTPVEAQKRGVELTLKPGEEYSFELYFDVLLERQKTGKNTCW